MYLWYTVFVCGVLLTLCSADIDEIQTVNQEIEILKEENQALEEIVTQLEKQLRALQCDASCNLPIGFAVHYSQGLQEVNAGDRVEYDVILTNAGDGYDVQGHFFQCPVSGYYHFHLSVYSDQLHNMDLSSAAIVMDGNRLAGQRMFKQGPQDHFSTASNSIYVICEKEQNVWVEIVEDSQISGNENILSIFSGYLLTQIF